MEWCKMFKIGEYQLLEIVRETEFGYRLSDGNPEDTVLLPKNEVIGDVDVEDSVMVFIYLDTKDQIIATMKTPKATI